MTDILESARQHAEAYDALVAERDRLADRCTTLDRAYGDLKAHYEALSEQMREVKAERDRYFAFNAEFTTQFNNIEMFIQQCMGKLIDKARIEPTIEHQDAGDQIPGFLQEGPAQG